MRFVVYDKDGNIYTQGATSGRALEDAVRKFNPSAKLNTHNNSGRRQIWIEMKKHGFRVEFRVEQSPVTVGANEP